MNDRLRCLISVAVVLFLATAGSAAVCAKEGMFTPDQLPEIADDLKAAGLGLAPESLQDLTAFPMGAVISLGGCTASFVSEAGLAVTNHHCARGSVQFNSTEENNYLERGFLAANYSAEIPAAPGSRMYVTTSVSDVTDRVTGQLSDELTGDSRYDAIERNRKQLIAECESDPGYRCQVPAFFGGLQYKLVKRLEIRDVRLVYAPADSIGRYGGDIDNWQWPRHTGDFAFYRAYVDQDGHPADYSVDNLPFVPAHTLSVSAAGLDDGDFVMVAGYPGSTSRYKRLAVVSSTFNWRYPTFISLLSDWINAIEDAAPVGSDTRIRYEARLAGLNNYAKNLKGQIDGARRVGLVERRYQREAQLNEWVSGQDEDPGFARAIKALDALSQESADAERRLFWFDNVTRPQLLDVAAKLYRLSIERQKPDAERKSGYQERDMQRFEQRMQALERRFDPTVDRAEWLVFLDGYLAQPAAQRIAALDAAMGLTDVASAADLAPRLGAFYDNTQLSDIDVRLALMRASTAELESSDDPFMQLAIALFDEQIAQEKAENDRKGRFATLEPQYMQAIIAWQRAQGFAAYPDANSTLRVTYGNVMGGAPRDGLIYAPFTTLSGIAEKDTGEAPFNAPATQLAAIERRDYGSYALPSIGSVPVNFLTDLDSTGGNSGSATLNAQGELVGLLFDGTFESVNSDWDFDPRVTRSIHVDSRYMLWVMEKVDGASHLIDEMTIVGR